MKYNETSHPLFVDDTPTHNIHVLEKQLVTSTHTANLIWCPSDHKRRHQTNDQQFSQTMYVQYIRYSQYVNKTTSQQT